VASGLIKLFIEVNVCRYTELLKKHFV
jgi:hypothetical protein